MGDAVRGERQGVAVWISYVLHAKALIDYITVTFGKGQFESGRVEQVLRIYVDQLHQTRHTTGHKEVTATDHFKPCSRSSGRSGYLCEADCASGDGSQSL